MSDLYGLYLLTVEDEIEPSLDGPYRTERARLNAARTHRATFGDGHGLFRLDLSENRIDVATFTGREIEQPIELLHLQRTGRYRPILCGAAGGIVVDDPEQATCPDCLHARRKTDVHLAITYGPTKGTTWCYEDGGPQTDDPAAATCTDCLDRYREHAS